MNLLEPAPPVKLSLQWKWFVGLAVLLAALLGVVNLGLDLTLPPYLIARIRTDLEREARLVREVCARIPASEANPVAHDLARKTGLRVTVIAADGTVIGESDKSPDEMTRMENHLYRPEVQEAFRQGVGSIIRPSATLGVDLMYVAVLATNAFPGAEAAPPTIIRVALPLHEIAQTTGRVRRIVAAASVAVALVALPLVFWLARRTTQPILRMRDVAGRVAQGDFSERTTVRGSGEVEELAAALDEMSAQLEGRLRELRQEKADLGAILANMTEGVLVTDAAGKIRLANNALCRQFQLDAGTLGKTVLEVFRNVALQELVAATGREPNGAARELTFLGPEERVFEVNAAGLRGEGTGVVVVFHDITRLKQLENVRKEFVANVSHELRTPLSIIKGYVETLLDEQPPDAATSRQFLQTVQKHSRRLEALIADLLSISELESQQARLNLAPVALRPTVEAVLEELRQRAADKKMTVALEIPDHLSTVRADSQRIHQVLLNLLDNAVKYTSSGGRVTVTARETGADVEVCVADNGPGIAPEHLPRIFERFYRADKARSRELGGTGLGLSIVKHIVQAHGGRVWAESTLGQGSAFHFTLPRA